MLATTEWYRFCDKFTAKLGEEGDWLTTRGGPTELGFSKKTWDIRLLPRYEKSIARLKFFLRRTGDDLSLDAQYVGAGDGKYPIATRRIDQALAQRGLKRGVQYKRTKRDFFSGSEDWDDARFDEAVEHVLAMCGSPAFSEIADKFKEIATELNATKRETE